MVGKAYSCISHVVQDLMRIRRGEKGAAHFFRALYSDRAIHAPQISISSLLRNCVGSAQVAQPAHLAEKTPSEKSG